LILILENTQRPYSLIELDEAGGIVMR
jgi:hypothetical protein